MLNLMDLQYLKCLVDLMCVVCFAQMYSIDLLRTHQCGLGCVGTMRTVIFKNYYIISTVNQQILAAIKFGVSQNKVIYVNLAAIKFGVSPRPVYAVYDQRICWWRQILANTCTSPNSPNIIARQNLLIYSIHIEIKS